VSSYNATKLDPLYTGGAVSEDDLLAFVDQLLVSINGVLTKAGQDPVPIDDIEAKIVEALDKAGTADVDLTGDGTADAFSIGLVATAETATIIP
jgi:hypothetical protein